MYQKWEGTMLKFLACYKRTNSKAADILFCRSISSHFLCFIAHVRKTKSCIYLFLRYDLCSFFARKLF